MILTKQLFLSIAILLASHLSLSAQSDAWRPSEHYTNMVTQFENRNDIDTSTIVMLGNSLTEFGGDWSENWEGPASSTTASWATTPRECSADSIRSHPTTRRLSF